MSHLLTTLRHSLFEGTGLVVRQNSRATSSIISAESDFSGHIVPTEDNTAYLESYQKSVWVFSAVVAIASSAAQVPIKVFRKSLRGNKQTEITNDPRFAFLQFPNRQTSRYRFYEAALSFLVLSGDVYIELFPNRQSPTAMFLLRPDFMQPIPDTINFIKGYKFDPRKLFDEGAVTFDLDEIAHFHNFNPFSNFEGQSSLRAATLAITSDLLSQQYNNAFFENSARLEGLFRTDKVLQPEKIKQLTDRLITLRQGAKRAHTPLLLDGGLDYKPISLPPKDAEYGEGRQLNRQDLLAALRTTPVQVGLQNANYAEARQQTVVFNRNTIAPTLVAFAEDLTTHVIRYIDPQAFCVFDTAEVESFFEDAAERESRIIKQYLAGIITLDQALKDLRRDPVGGELGELRVLPSNFIQFNQNNIPQSQQPAPPTKDIFDDLCKLTDHLRF